MGEIKKALEGSHISGFGCLIKIKFRIFYKFSFFILCLTYTAKNKQPEYESTLKSAMLKRRVLVWIFLTEKLLSINYSHSFPLGPVALK